VFFLAVLLAAGLAVSAVPGSDGGQFMVNDLGHLPGGNRSAGYAVNGEGSVAGSAVCGGVPCVRAVAYADGRLTDLGTLGGPTATALGINGSGHIVGFSTNSAEQQRAFLVAPGGSMTDLGTLGGTAAIAYGINDSGVAVGAATTADHRFQAARFADGLVTGLGSLGGQSAARAINGQGQIVGWSALAGGGVAHAFLYENGTMRDLGTWGGDSSTAIAINDVGQITGERCVGIPRASCRAYLYDSRDGRFVLIPSLGGAFSEGLGINGAGDVVGASQLSSGERRAFLYRNGRIYYLQDLIPADSGWTLLAAHAINDRGQIVGEGAGPAGERGFVLTPTLSSAWANRDVGPTGITGSAERGADGRFLVRGAGADIWNTADQFHFVHKPLAVDGQIVARVESLTNTSPYAKAGVMIRNSLATDDANVILDIKPDGGVEFMQRGSKAAHTRYIAGAYAPPPYWLRLSRDGSMVTGSISSDGRIWVDVGSTTMTAIGETQDFGLAVTSHDTSRLNTALFSGVSLLPAGWSAHDVGPTRITGSTSYKQPVFSIEAAGRDIWDTVDAFHFVHRPHQGDGEIVARILRVPNTHRFAKAGVMIRDGLAQNAPHVILDVKPDGGVEFMQRRTRNRETTYLAGGAAAPPSWLKLRREGTTVTGYVSITGSTWTMIGSTQVEFPAWVEMGVAVTSHDDQRLGVAEVGSVEIRP
jgi:probable HAF family extracellular repeat protein